MQSSAGSLGGNNISESSEHSLWYIRTEESPPPVRSRESASDTKLKTDSGSRTTEDRQRTQDSCRDPGQQVNFVVKTAED